MQRDYTASFCRSAELARKRYSRIIRTIFHRHQDLYALAMSREERASNQPREPLIDLSQSNYQVLEALSAEALLVFDSQENREFILRVPK
jgi:hypothetical protein